MMIDKVKDALKLASEAKPSSLVFDDVDSEVIAELIKHLKKSYDTSQYELNKSYMAMANNVYMAVSVKFKDMGLMSIYSKGVVLSDEVLADLYERLPAQGVEV